MGHNATPPVSPPTAPTLDGWYIGKLYADPACNGTVIYANSEALGRCEMVDNQHYTISKYVLNITSNTADVISFYYTDSTCTVLMSTSPISFTSSSVGAPRSCIPVGNNLHWMQFEYDSTYGSTPSFGFTGPATVSFDRNTACGKLSLVQSFIVYQPQTCYATWGAYGSQSYQTQCRLTDVHGGSLVPDDVSHAYVQSYSDNKCALPLSSSM